MDPLELIRSTLNKEIAARCDELSSGIAQDFSQYRELTGIIIGLRLALRDVNDTIRKINSDPLN